MTQPRLYCYECEAEHEAIICTRCGGLIHPYAFYGHPRRPMIDGACYPTTEDYPDRPHCSSCATEVYLAAHLPKGELWGELIGYHRDRWPKFAVFRTPIADKVVGAYNLYTSNFGDKRAYVRFLLNDEPWWGVYYESTGAIRARRARRTLRTDADRIDYLHFFR